MNMGVNMSIRFKTIGDKLILIYAPDIGIDEIRKRFHEQGYLHIKNTFYVTKKLLCEDVEFEDFCEDTICFCIGKVKNLYTGINSNVLRTKHTFYFANDVALKSEMFIAYRNISILRKIDEIIEHDFYVGGNWEFHGGISEAVFKNLIKLFPKTAELDYYAHKRIANVIKEYFPECDKYEDIYNNYIKSKKNFSAPSTESSISKYNIKIELEQFSAINQELKTMLSQYKAIGEAEWQTKIFNILQVLYPKYICCEREVKFRGCEKYDKKPDFLLVDANGFVDILEIKKADVCILRDCCYRNNYIASMELSGTIQQIEKYIYCLNSSDKAKEDVSNKLRSSLPNGLNIQIVNPQGILILGRSNELNEQQTKDFELIKRQYKHIADIMTYDDLLFRLDNIVKSLELKATK